MATKTKCEKKAAARKAQATYVKKNKSKHAASVKKSEAKASTKGGASKAGGKAGSAAGSKATAASKSPGEGKHGSKMGRPREGC